MKKLLFFVCAIFAFVACTQSPIEEQQGIEIDTPEILTVGFEDGDDTRIQLNEAQKTVWNKEDLVSVFYRSDANQKWQYQGESGERVGNLKRVENATSTTKTTKAIVVYPYSQNYWLNTDSYAIEATLPATQHYTAGSYGIGSNLMVSQSEFTQFSLKSVCGWLKLQLTGNGGVVKSIKFRGNNEEQVAGLIYVDTATAEVTLASDMGGTDDNNAGGNLVFDDTILTELTLDCGEGVTLGEEVTTFYLSLPPQTFTNGFTVDIECIDNEPFTLSTTSELIIERNTIQPMAAVEVEHEPIEVKPANNEIWYTNGSTTEATTPYKTDVFGVNIVSNTYDAEKECWVIKFDGDVTTIGSSAFYGCSGLTSVTIPDSVTTIGNYAFRSCTSLTSVTIPNSVTSIGAEAFNNTGITGITIPESVTSIGYNTFDCCYSLTSVYITDIAAWCNISFAGPSSNPLFYAKNLYLNNELITDLIIPDGITKIGSHAFYGYTSLTSITIPDSVTSIGDFAFSGCDSLTSVHITDIAAWCNISFGNEASNPLRYAENLYLNNELVTDLIIPDGVTKIGSYAFRGCTSLTSVTIPDSVTSIGDYAFFDCSSLTSVTIGNGVTAIGYQAFSSCDSLKSITIPDSVTSIDSYAFSGCNSLTSVTIGNGVTSIGNEAFGYCNSLKEVYCKPTTPPTGGYSMFFSNASGRTIYVPSNSVSAYKSASVWSDYASYIVGYDF